MSIIIKSDRELTSISKFFKIIYNVYILLHVLYWQHFNEMLLIFLTDCKSQLEFDTVHKICLVKSFQELWYSFIWKGCGSKVAGLSLKLDHDLCLTIFIKNLFSPISIQIKNIFLYFLFFYEREFIDLIQGHQC